MKIIAKDLYFSIWNLWREKTLSTLNYATKTMNIKNKPVIKMDAKEQIKFNKKISC